MIPESHALRPEATSAERTGRGRLAQRVRFRDEPPGTSNEGSGTGAAARERCKTGNDHETRGGS